MCSQGYTVRAVVRDKTRPDKVDHILAINEEGFPGSVELHEAVRTPAARAALGPLGSSWPHALLHKAATKPAAALLRATSCVCLMRFGQHSRG